MTLFWFLFVSSDVSVFSLTTVVSFNFSCSCFSLSKSTTSFICCCRSSNFSLISLFLLSSLIFSLIRFPLTPPYRKSWRCLVVFLLFRDTILLTMTCMFK
uniref:Uncharacterized protein n=1 Tax=Pieris brassicae granulosis virus TaxID=10465 RepID=A0A7G9U8X1_GVPB|nr:hypothetical protein [Pieris brassicae granulovirus]